jgi:hypothetical protein
MMAALARRATAAAAAAAAAAAEAEQNGWEDVGGAFEADGSIEAELSGDEEEEEEEEEVNEAEVRQASSEVDDEASGEFEPTQPADDESGETTAEATASVAGLRRAAEAAADAAAEETTRAAQAAAAAAAERAERAALLATLDTGAVAVAVYLQGSAEPPFCAQRCGATTPLAALLLGAAEHFAAGSDPPPAGWATHAGTALRRAPGHWLRKERSGPQVAVPVRGALPAEWTTVGDALVADAHDEAAAEGGGGAAAAAAALLGAKRLCEGGGAPGGLASWEVYADHDAFSGDTAATKPFESFESAAKLCLAHGYGGFVVQQQEAAFKRPARAEVREKRLRCKGAVLYVAPPLAKRRLSSAGLKRRLSAGKVTGDGNGSSSGGNGNSSSPEPAARWSQQPAVLVLVAAPFLPPLTAVAKLSVGKRECAKVSVAVSAEFDAPPLAADNPARAMGFLLSPAPAKHPPKRPGSPTSPQRSDHADSPPPRRNGSPAAAASPPPLPSEPTHRRFVTWRWRCPAGLELGFSAAFHPTPSLSAKASPPQTIVAPFVRAASGEGEWCLAGEGAVVFEFDNSDAAFKGRDVEYAIATHDL